MTETPSFWEAYWNHIMPKQTIAASASSWYFVPICEHCGGHHAGKYCPYIKSIEYHENGAVKHVEFYPRPKDERPIEVSSGHQWVWTMRVGGW